MLQILQQSITRLFFSKSWSIRFRTSSTVRAKSISIYYITFCICSLIFLNSISLRVLSSYSSKKNKWVFTNLFYATMSVFIDKNRWFSDRANTILDSYSDRANIILDSYSIENSDYRSDDMKSSSSSEEMKRNFALSIRKYYQYFSTSFLLKKPRSWLTLSRQITHYCIVNPFHIGNC